MKISGIIMAAGLSKRMGTNKLFLDFKGQDLYKGIFDLVEELNLDQVVLVSSYEEILADGKKRRFKTIYNPDNQEGKAASIRLGVEGADPEASLMFFVADQPLLRLETCQDLIKAYKEKEAITFPRTDSRRGSPVIFPKKYRGDLLALKGDQGGMLLVQGQETNQVLIQDESELWDIDTHHQYQDLRKKYE